ncbi:MAG: hypothetical protein M3198_00360 [Actinomycetota bacterium]|nr:hypothetical protein [Actinomycetota bacterium]
MIQLVIILAIAAGFFVVLVPSFAAIAVPLLFGVIFLRLLLVGLFPRTGNNETTSRVAFWTYLAFALHLAIGLAVQLKMNGTEFLAAPDAQHYHQGAMQIVRHWGGSGALPLMGRGKEGFYYLVAALYQVFGPRPVAGLIVNASLAAAVIPLVTSSTRRLFGIISPRYVAIPLFLMPSFLVWPSQLLREAGVLFFMAVVIHTAILLTERITAARVVVGSLAMALLFTFRAPVGMVLAGTLLIALAFAQRSLVGGVGSSVAWLGLLAALVLGAGLGYSGYRWSTQADISTLNQVQVGTAVGAGSGFFYDSEMSTPLQAIGRLPISMARFAFGPFPWETPGIRQAPGLVETALILLLLPSLVRGLKKGWKLAGRKSFVLLLPAVFLAALLSLVVGNYGLLLRERAQVTLLLIPFIALGLASRREAVTLTSIQRVPTEDQLSPS